MHLFLTSSPYDHNLPEGCDLPCVLFEKNGFVSLLKERFVKNSACVVVAATPGAYALNDEIVYTLHRAFAWHGMSFSSSAVVDRRNVHDLPQLIRESGMVVLAGGHVPTQNAFFREINLRELLRGYEGIVMGISAGSMNCCKTVYAQPEEPGEAVDPSYRRFLDGLGLTDVMVLPHYQKVSHDRVDGLRLFEDITIPDSVGRVFYAIPDGSFVLQENGAASLYGEALVIRDGTMNRFTQDGQTARVP